MSAARVAVLFRTYHWDEATFRAALLMFEQCVGLDFLVLADETECGRLDVRPFRKLGHVQTDFESLGLPCLAPANKPPLWWNCDYGLYDAALRLPDYDYFLMVEGDVAVNLKLRPLVEETIAAGLHCLTPFGIRPIEPTWTFAGSCCELPYAKRGWTPLSTIFISVPAARYLLSERLRLARLHAEGKLSVWPICEGFFGSALLESGYTTGTLKGRADMPHYSSVDVFLDTDTRARIPGSLSHAVLSPDQYWPKFAARGFAALMQQDRTQLRLAREALIAAERSEYGDWRVLLSDGNLALDRPARQSSVSRWSRPAPVSHPDPNGFDAGGANCGVLSGKFGFHTDREERPWWEVDLQRVCAVQRIRITNPKHMAMRARRLVVQVSEDAQRWDEAYRKADDRVFGGNDDPLTCDLRQPVAARWVRVVLDGTDYLHLSQVEVFGTAGAA